MLQNQITVQGGRREEGESFGQGRNRGHRGGMGAKSVMSSGGTLVKQRKRGSSSTTKKQVTKKRFYSVAEYNTEMQRSIASTAVKALRSSAPLGKRAANANNVRNLSGGHGDADLAYWRNISFGGFGFMVLLAGYEYKIHLDHQAHGHHFDPSINNFPYMRTRNKAYPWDCSDCGLFDQKCWDECKGRATSGHH